MTLTVTARAWATPGTVEDLLRDDDVVFDQQPTRVGGLASDTLFVDRSGLVAWQQVGADYRISTGFRQLPAGIEASTLPGSTGLATAYRGTASIGADLTYEIVSHQGVVL